MFSFKKCIEENTLRFLKSLVFGTEYVKYVVQTLLCNALISVISHQVNQKQNKKIN